MTAVRLRYIDIAKGFAIICVVCGHVLIYDFYGFTEAWSKSLLVQFIYSFHMPLFFFLSGLVVSPPSSVKDIPKDIWKRFRTLLMPMFVIGGIYSLAIKYDLSFLADGMKYGYWYFIALFYCYLLNYLTINNLKYRGGGFVIQVMVLLVIWKILPHAVRYMQESIQNILSIGQLISYFPYFLIGSVIKRFNLHDLFFRNGYVVIVAATIWGCSSLIHFPYSNYLVTLAAIFVIMNICSKIEQQKLLGNKMLEYIGTNTIYIYCFHYFVLQLMKMLFMKEWLISINTCIFLDLLLCLVPTVFAVWFSLFIKDIICRESIIMKLVFNKQFSRKRTINGF